ncbi:hypothetical protein NA78x_001924 [Anatilimnocola sp. NA78]|uniref:hypothetical protein n=1 Tax=Anatilimnocola sp. NA78 TaxID=3415683 RepID=UPI003CE50243
MDPLHFCIAVGPLSVYLLLLGLINLRRRPFITTGGRDSMALGIAIVGFVIVGPMELFLPEAAAANLHIWAWAMLVTLYLLSLVLLVLLMRPRLVIYNITGEQLRPVLSDVVTDLDPEARWAGDALSLPELGVQLHLEPTSMFKNVQLIAAGPQQNLAGWRRLEMELDRAFRKLDGAPNPYGASLMMFGFALAGYATYGLYQDPEAVVRTLQTMLRW